jgi:hypothetical protein
MSTKSTFATRSVVLLVAMGLLAWFAGLGLASPAAAASRAPATGGSGPLVRVSGPSPFAACTSVEATNPNTEYEPYVGVNPTNPSNLVGIWTQDRQERGAVVARSTNGGASWQTAAVPGLTKCSGGTDDIMYDPWLTFSPNGDLYTSALTYNYASGDDALRVSKSADGGLSFGPPVTVAVGPCCRLFDDKDSITADPTHPRYVYATWTLYKYRDKMQAPPGVKVSLMFSRSGDGGATWTRPRALLRQKLPVDPAQDAQIVVRPTGRLLLFFNHYRIARKGPGPRVPRPDQRLTFFSSPDRGLTWSAPKKVARLTPRANFSKLGGAYDPDLCSDPSVTDSCGLIISAGSAGEYGADVAVDPNNGRLYAVWEDSRFSNHGDFTNVNLLADAVAFSMSSDGGTTWSKPVKVSHAPGRLPLGDQQAFLPSVAVNSAGTIGVSYYDLRHNTSAPGLLTDQWITYCKPGKHQKTCANADAWHTETRVTNRSFDMEKAVQARGGGFFVGDYEGLATQGTRFHAFFSMPHHNDLDSVFHRTLTPAP